MLDTVLRGVYLVGLALGSAVRARERRRSKSNPVAAERRTALDTLVMALPGLGLVVAPLAYFLTPWLEFADYRLPLALKGAFGLVGAAVYGVGVWLLWRSHADLGRNWSPTLEVREGHSLVTGGVYRRIRHPMYAAHWLWGIGQALLLQNWLVGPLTLLCMLPLQLIRVPREERMMLDEFGEAYRQYAARTGRIVPRLS